MQATLPINSGTSSQSLFEWRKNRQGHGYNVGIQTQRMNSVDSTTQYDAKSVNMATQCVVQFVDSSTQFCVKSVSSATQTMPKMLSKG